MFNQSSMVRVTEGTVLSLSNEFVSYFFVRKIFLIKILYKWHTCKHNVTSLLSLPIKFYTSLSNIHSLAASNTLPLSFQYFNSLRCHLVWNSKGPDGMTFLQRMCSWSGWKCWTIPSWSVPWTQTARGRNAWRALPNV